MPRNYGIFGSGQIPRGVYDTKQAERGAAARSGDVEALMKSLIETRDRRTELDRLKVEQRQADEDRKRKQVEEDYLAQVRDAETMAKIERMKDEPFATPQEDVPGTTEMFEMEEPEEPIIGKGPDGKDINLGVKKGRKMKLPISIPGQTLNVPHDPLTREDTPFSITSPTGREMEIPIPSGAQQRADEEAAFAEKLDQEARLAEAKRAPQMTLEEVLGAISGEGDPETELPNAAVQALMQLAGKTAAAPTSKTVKGVGLVERQPDGQWVVAVAEQTPKEGLKPLRDLSSKDARDLAGMRTMALRARELGDLVSGAEYNLAKWTPDAIAGFAAQYIKPEEGETIPDSFYVRALKVEPQYFLFAAEMLKAMQGSRPSDRDMEWYIENLPRANDPPEVKRDKIKNMVNKLSVKYNNEVAALKAVRFDMSGFPVMDPDSILEGLEDTVPDEPTFEEQMAMLDKMAQEAAGAQ